MTQTFVDRPLTSRKRKLDLSPEAFGELRRSDDILTDPDALRTRMADDGYLFLPGGLNRAEVCEVRQVLAQRLAEAGVLEPGTDPLETVAAKNVARYFMPELAQNNEPLRRVLYDGPMMDIFGRLIGGPVRHFDFTWMRAVSPGQGTAPHCDVVYMGRGTHDLYTAWTPLGDIPRAVGGLIVLENSHKQTKRLAEYQQQDVDSYCANGPNAEKITSGAMHWEHWDGSGHDWDGAISHDPVALREQLGGRWLTADYQMGDVLIFSIKTVHASLDNGSDRIRLSSDTRYQHADAPADERWIGDTPIAHGLAAKRGRIC